MNAGSRLARALRSSSLAVALLVAMAVAAAVGSLVESPAVPGSPPGVASAPLARLLGLERPFASPLFLGLVGLLAVNVVLCTLHRCSRGGLRARGLRGATDLAIHASLILVLAGGAAKGAFGTVMTQNVAVGGETGTMYDWGTGRDEPLGYTLRIDSFREERYPLRVAIGVRRADTGEKVGIVELREGREARVPGAGFVLAQPAYDPAAGFVSVAAFLPGGPRRLGFPTRPGEEASHDVEGVRLVLVAWRSEVRAARAEASIVAGGATVARGVLEPNGSFSHAGTSFFMTAWGTDRYGIASCGIQAARDPGAPLFWAGCVLLALAVPLHLAAKRRPGGLREA